MFATASPSEFSPLSPSLLPPSNRRGVSLLGSQQGLDYFDQDGSAGAQPRSMDESTNLAETPNGLPYAFDRMGSLETPGGTGGGRMGGDDGLAQPPLISQQSNGMGDVLPSYSSSILQPPHLNLHLSSHTSLAHQQATISPQQAQALLAAQVMLQNQLAVGGVVRGISGNSQGVSNTYQDDDPMAILSMSRGNSNLQAALDELDSRTGGNGGGQQPGPWQDYDGSNHSSSLQSGYPNTAIDDGYEADGMNDGVQELGSHQNLANRSGRDPRLPHSQQFEMGMMNNLPYGIPPVREISGDRREDIENDGDGPEPPATTSSESTEGSSVGHTTSIMMDGRFLMALSQSPPPGNPTYSRTSSASSVSSLVNRSGPPSPQPNQRMLMPQASLISPQPPSTLAQQLLQQQQALSSGNNGSIPTRRHSGHTTLSVSHLLHPGSSTSPHPHSAGVNGGSSNTLPPSQPQHRMLGRSPSADSLPKTLNVASLQASSSLQVQNNGGLVSLQQSAALQLQQQSGLRLHPSPTQMQQGQFIQHSPPQPSYSAPSHQLRHARSHSPQPTSSLQGNVTVKIEPVSSSASVGGGGGRSHGRLQGHRSADSMPSGNPNFGRSYSHDSVPLSQQEQAYYSDGGSADYSLSPRLGPVYNLAPSAPASAGTSPRGSGVFPQGFPGVFSSSHVKLEAGGVKLESDSMSSGSSGISSISSGGGSLHGPGPTRSQAHGGRSGSNEMHRLLMLHAPTNGTVSTLLPLCPSGSTNASAIGSSSSCGNPSDRIGAYTREERAKRLARYNDKRSRRCWTKRVLYQVRKTFADGRKRVGGRFVKKANPNCPCPDICLPTCPYYIPVEEQHTATGGAGSSTSSIKAPTKKK